MTNNDLLLADGGKEPVMTTVSAAGTRTRKALGKNAPSLAQRRYLSQGLDQPGGKLPLFDRTGQRIPARTIRACMSAGWCAPWYANPIEPKWLVCKLTDNGRAVAGKS